MNNQEETLKPRIYVACLASYNIGILCGEWIDADQSKDEILTEIQKILKSSSIDGAEEFAIHDYDDFWEAELGEYPGIETVAKVGEFLVEHGRLGARIFDYCGQDLEQAEKMIEERYYGEYESLEDYAREYIENCYDLPEFVKTYFDYDRYGRDLELGDDVVTLRTGYQEVHIFSRDW